MRHFVGCAEGAALVIGGCSAGPECPTIGSIAVSIALALPRAWPGNSNGRPEASPGRMLLTDVATSQQAMPVDKISGSKDRLGVARREVRNTVRMTASFLRRKGLDPFAPIRRSRRAVQRKRPFGRR
ncbi:hypothetical protein [Cupriavidus sp. USMAA2-4]|nr:hypothetical protein [Cupriavidus sp. USMAA2-4]